MGAVVQPTSCRSSWSAVLRSSDNRTRLGAVTQLHRRRNGISHPRAGHPATHPHRYGDVSRVTTPLGIEDRSTIAVVLVDQSGHVLWLGAADSAHRSHTSSRRQWPTTADERKLDLRESDDHCQLHRVRGHHEARSMSDKWMDNFGRRRGAPATFAPSQRPPSRLRAVALTAARRPDRNGQRDHDDRKVVNAASSSTVASAPVMARR